uniref:Disease resistance protein winged helix domain-containing protein n=1 Tax=Picea sitchensis TaxID=3332 RepID=A9NLU7_PICSI|nr:unknown [Picea sitchensis]
MKSKRAINDWKFALRQMQKVDLSFPITHPRIDRDLYQRLRWSYDALPTTADLKNCFLYCALFPEDALIREEDLVQMWISEGLIKTSDGDYDYLLDTGRSYVKLLLDRCF